MSWRPSTARRRIKNRPRCDLAALQRQARAEVPLHNGPVVSAKYIYTYAKYHKIANENYAYWACLQKKDYPEALKKWFLKRTTPTRR